MLYKHKTTVSLITLIMLVAASLSSCRPSLPPGVRFLSDTGTQEATGLAWSSDNKTLAVARQIYGEGDPPYPVESYIDFLDVEKLSSHTLEKTRATGSFASITGMIWSPKKNQIAFARFGSIWLVNLDDEKAPIRLGDGEVCAWSKNGKMLAVIEHIRANNYTLLASKIYTLDITTGEKQEKYSSNILDNTIAWAPDSNRLAFVELDEKSNSTLNILDLDSGTRKMPIYSRAITSLTWSPDGTMLAIMIESLPSGESYYVPKLNIIKADDGSILWESSILKNLYLYSTWSPDGKTIAYAQDDGIYAFDVDTLLKNK
jgi:WD40 repeat protein